MKVLRIYRSSSSIEVKVRMYDGSFKKFPGSYLIACVNFFLLTHLLIDQIFIETSLCSSPCAVCKETERKERGNKKKKTGYFSRGFE